MPRRALLLCCHGTCCCCAWSLLQCPPHVQPSERVGVDVCQALGGVLQLVMGHVLRIKAVRVTVPQTVAGGWPPKDTCKHAPSEVVEVVGVRERAARAGWWLKQELPWLQAQ